MDDRKRRKDDLIKELVRLRTKVARLNKALSRTTITNLNTKIDSREKRMEESLRQSKKFHRSLMQTALDGIWINNLEGQILDLNQAYCKMTGYSRDELLKMSISDIEAKKILRIQPGTSNKSFSKDMTDLNHAIGEKTARLSMLK